MNLPSILFYYPRGIIIKTRTTDNENKKIPPYIPFGRLLTDIFVESCLVIFLTEEATFTEDLVPIIGDHFNARNLKNMNMLKKISFLPLTVLSNTIYSRRIAVNNFPFFTQGQQPICVAEYMQMMMTEGNDML